jgi:hypothetical protein
VTERCQTHESSGASGGVLNSGPSWHAGSELLSSRGRCSAQPTASSIDPMMAARTPAMPLQIGMIGTEQ